LYGQLIVTRVGFRSCFELLKDIFKLFSENEREKFTRFEWKLADP
jgi:hypothetical protein